MINLSNFNNEKLINFCTYPVAADAIQVGSPPMALYLNVLNIYLYNAYLKLKVS